MFIMSAQQQPDDIEFGPPVHEVRRQFAEERMERVRQASSFLLELAQDQPHARWSAPEIVHRIADGTGIARALIVSDLHTISDEQAALDDDGSTFRFGNHEGNQYVQVIRPTEPVRRLTEDL